MSLHHSQLSGCPRVCSGVGYARKNVPDSVFVPVWSQWPSAASVLQSHPGREGGRWRSHDEYISPPRNKLSLLLYAYLNESYATDWHGSKSSQYQNTSPSPLQIGLVVCLRTNACHSTHTPARPTSCLGYIRACPFLRHPQPIPCTLSCTSRVQLPLRPPSFTVTHK